MNKYYNRDVKHDVFNFLRNIFCNNFEIYLRNRTRKNIMMAGYIRNERATRGELRYLISHKVSTK